MSLPPSPLILVSWPYGPFIMLEWLIKWHRPSKEQKMQLSSLICSFFAFLSSDYLFKTFYMIWSLWCRACGSCDAIFDGWHLMLDARRSMLSWMTDLAVITGRLDRLLIDFWSRVPCTSQCTALTLVVKSPLCLNQVGMALIEGRIEDNGDGKDDYHERDD